MLNTAITRLKTSISFNKYMIQSMRAFDGTSTADIVIAVCEKHIVDLENVLNDLKMIEQKG